MKKTTSIVLVLITLVFVFLVTGCNPNNTAATADTIVNTEPELVGTFRGFDNTDDPWFATADGQVFTVYVSPNHIEIYWTVDPDSSPLYWSGTFPQEEGKKITSVADKSAMSTSELASSDDTKVFTVFGGEFTFEASTFDTPKTIYIYK